MNTLELYTRKNWIPRQNGDRAYMEHINDLIKKINEIITDDTNDNASLSGDNTFTGNNTFNEIINAVGGLDANSSVILFSQGVYGATAHAAGGQANATMLNGFFNTVTTCVTAGDSCKLPSAQAGMFALIFVDYSCASSMNLFPATGDTLNGGAVNAPIAMNPGLYAFCSCNVDGNWNVQLQLDGSYVSDLVGAVATNVTQLQNQSVIFYNPSTNVDAVDFTNNTWIKHIISTGGTYFSPIITGNSALIELNCTNCDSLSGIAIDLSAAIHLKYLTLNSVADISVIINLGAITNINTFYLNNVYYDSIDLSNQSQLTGEVRTVTTGHKAVTLFALPNSAPSMTKLTLGFLDVPTITGLGAGSNHAALKTIEIYNNAAITSIDISGISDVDDPTGTISIVNCSSLTSITLGGTSLHCISHYYSGNALTIVNVDAILLALDTAGELNGDLDLSGGTNGIPTGGALNANVVALQGKGWTVTHNV